MGDRPGDRDRRRHGDRLTIRYVLLIGAGLSALALANGRGRASDIKVTAKRTGAHGTVDIANDNGEHP